MTLQIGRVGLSVTFDNPYTFAVTSGRRTTMSGEIVASSLAEAVAVRQQLLGTFGGEEGPPEPVIPVVWSEDASIDGYYRPVSCSVENKPLSLVDYSFTFDVELERVRGYQTPLHWFRSVSRERAGAPSGGGGTSEDPWWAVPADVQYVDINGTSSLFYTVTGPDCSARYYVDATNLASGVGKYRINPADFYDSRVRVLVNGYEHVGFDPISLTNEDDWELSNGRTRIRGASSSSHTLRLNGPLAATPTSWGAVDYALILGFYIAGSRKILRPDAFEVVHYSHERITLLLSGGVSTTGTNDNYEVMAYVTLRRGSAYMEVTIRTYLSGQCSIKDVGAAALTAVSAGKTYTSSADDADGNRLFIATGTTQNAAGIANGEVYRNVSGTSTSYGIGIELGGDPGSSTPNISAELIDNYWADQTITGEIG